MANARKDELPGGQGGAPRRRLLSSRFVKKDVGATFMAILDIVLVAGLVAAINVAVTRPGCSYKHRGTGRPFRPRNGSTPWPPRR